MDREPITTGAALADLDEAEMIEGYRDGYSGDAEPGDNRSLSYWHGWRNGSNDRAGRADAAQRALVRDFRQASSSIRH